MPTTPVKLLEICATGPSGTYTDVTGYLKPGGFKVKRNDIDAEGAGRSPLTGDASRDRLAIKKDFECQCPELLPQSATEVLLPLIEPEYVWINYMDPGHGWRTGVKVYSNNVPANAAMIKDGVVYWKDVSFPLVEV